MAQTVRFTLDFALIACLGLTVVSCGGSSNQTDMDSSNGGGMNLVDECEICPAVVSGFQEFATETPESDGDGVFDIVDNCPDVPNPDQSDEDGNGIGDPCEETAEIEDLDGDGFLSIDDNCPSIFNPNQEDTNSNGAGDACDDADFDGILTPLDNCPEIRNPSQTDLDGNGFGDDCDPNDGDGDRIPDSVDNCPLASNHDQTDRNVNGIGDHCDDSDFGTLYNDANLALIYPQSWMLDESSSNPRIVAKFVSLDPGEFTDFEQCLLLKDPRGPGENLDEFSLGEDFEPGSVDSSSGRVNGVRFTRFQGLIRTLDNQLVPAFHQFIETDDSYYSIACGGGSINRDEFLAIMNSVVVR